MPHSCSFLGFTCLICLQLLATKLEWQAAQEKPSYCVSVETYVSARESKWQCTAASREVKLPWSFIHKKGRTRRSTSGLVKQIRFCVSFIVPWSQNGTFLVFKLIFVPILTYDPTIATRRYYISGLALGSSWRETCRTIRDCWKPWGVSIPCRAAAPTTVPRGNVGIKWMNNEQRRFVTKHIKGIANWQ